MKVEITGTPKEIAALVLAVQERQEAKGLSVGRILFSDGNSNNLITEHRQSRNGHSG